MTITDPFRDLAPWADPYRNYTTPTLPPVTTTTRTELDVGQVTKWMIEMGRKTSYMRQQMFEMSRELDDLRRYVKFLAANPGSSIEDWVAYEKVKHTITEAAKTGDTDGTKNS